MNYAYSIIGGGAWGTAIANSIAKDSKKNVIIWAKEKGVIKEINENKTNSLYLPGINLNKNIFATNILSKALAPIVFYVTPAQYFRDIFFSQKKFLKSNIKVIICSKGIEEKSGSLLSKIIDETNLDIDYAILSGPSFAAEVASGKPTALVLASKSLDLAEKIAEDLIFKQFRLYLSDDVIGVQVGAAIKNVYAIGSGIVEGINYGKSANAAFIARAIVEMSRFCIAVGGRKETIFGLSGLGDAILTCNSELSRNFILGRRIGIGHHINRIMKENLTVAEGYFTIKAINKIAISNSIDMPILSAIYSIIHENMDPIIVADRLLSRPKKEEDVI